MSQLAAENSSVPRDNLILRRAFGQHRGANRGISRAEFFGVCGEARTPPSPPCSYPFSASEGGRAGGTGRVGKGDIGIRRLRMTEEEEIELKAQLERLRQEHRDLDAAIEALQAVPGVDLIQVQRLKKRKLILRDRITFIEDQLTPDIIA